MSTPTQEHTHMDAPHMNRNPVPVDIDGNVPWPVPRVDSRSGYQCLAATRINHQPMTRPYNVVLQVIEHDDNGHPSKWVVRSAYWRFDEERGVMVPDSYGNGTYFWHGKPKPDAGDAEGMDAYLKEWERAISRFQAEAADALLYDVKLTAYGRMHPVTGERLED